MVINFASLLKRIFEPVVKSEKRVPMPRMTSVSYTHLYYYTWYYVKDGVLDWSYTGLTKYYGTCYYVENGILNWDYTGLTKYYGCLLYTSRCV